MKNIFIAIVIFHNNTNKFRIDQLIVGALEDFYKSLFDWMKNGQKIFHLVISLNEKKYDGWY